MYGDPVAVESLRTLQTIKNQLTWVLVLLAFIALGVLIVAGFALTVPLYPKEG